MTFPPPPNLSPRRVNLPPHHLAPLIRYRQKPRRKPRLPLKCKYLFTSTAMVSPLAPRELHSAGQAHLLPFHVLLITSHSGVVRPFGRIPRALSAALPASGQYEPAAAPVPRGTAPRSPPAQRGRQGAATARFQARKEAACRHAALTDECGGAPAPGRHRKAHVLGVAHRWYSRVQRTE